MRSPARSGGRAAKAIPQPAEPLEVKAISPAVAFSSRAASALALSSLSWTAAAASCGPRDASRRSCSVIAASVTADISEAPAWLK